MDGLASQPTATVVTDHDILIELRTTVNNMQQSLNAVTTDHEVRIRNLERTSEVNTGVVSAIKWVWTAIAALGALVGGLWWIH